jgi:Big-like domain-containing protein
LKTTLRLTQWLLLALCVPLASCAKRGPPSGGPPDLEPPRLVSTVPDSGAAHVPVDVKISLTWSEGMEPRSTGESVTLAPPVEVLHQRWSGRTLTLLLAHPLLRDHTYTMVVGGQARDRHGNAFGAGTTVVFTTADSFPPGLIAGKVEARGFEPGGTSLWCYDVGKGHAPDSTARDFDAIGIADAKGVFRVAGLAVPGRYRLWAFADLDGNRSYEPSRDILDPVDTTFALDAARPRVEGLTLRLVNPRAPARVKGAVLDTLGITEGTVRVFAVADTDSTRRVITDVQAEGGFVLELDPGLWWLRAFRDLDKNRAWKHDEEPASDILGIRVEPADDIKDVVLVLQRPRGVR